METKQKIVIGGIALIGWVAWINIETYIEQRAVTKARTEEFFRRQAMTPEQRIAEDQQKIQAQAMASETLRQQAEDQKRRKIKYACTEILKKSAHDPSSVEIEGAVTYPVDGLYVVSITGRARNGFGALRLGQWECKIAVNGDKISLVSFSEL